MPPPIAKGSTPAGASNEEQAARWVRSMFGQIAPRYDRLNHLLSFHTDRYWRARTVRILGRGAPAPARVLDLCCGTGDLTLALQRPGAASVMGSDFCHPMLVSAARKLSSRGFAPTLFEADALRLPLPDHSLDLITVAFGFRNLVDYRRGLREFLRVTKPGGRVAILEFSHPPNRAFAAAYRFYSRRLLPILGGWISGSLDAYRYLPESVQKFPGAPELAAEMKLCGFRQVDFVRMTGGIVALHIGTA
jgi:demethylmenaquinone methyltransferase/2-methoxy-6-polyprenyl-1,4-benzoquinol methylase